MLSNAQAIDFRAPYTTNPDFRKNVNRNELNYSDLNLSNMATQIRQGYLGQVNWAIIEACAVEKVGTKAHIYLTAAGGISPTVCRLATEGIIIELNAFHSPKSKGIHDVYEIEDHPHRTPIMITKASDRIGKPYVEVDASRIVGVIDCNVPDEARAFKDPDPITSQIGQNVADFLLANMRQGLIPPTFLNLQSGVGSGANAVLGALGQCQEVPNFNIYTEVLQDAPVQLMREGRVLSASACSLTVTNDCLRGIYDDMDFFKNKLVLRPSEISNCPEVIARIGVCSLNTAIECDIYGHVNSTKICGTKMMNGIGGSADFTNNAYLSIFTCGSTTKGGAISSIVPFASHIDHTNHFIDAVITEYGVADLRHKSDMQKAEALIQVALPAPAARLPEARREVQWTHSPRSLSSLRHARHLHPQGRHAPHRLGRIPEVNRPQPTPAGEAATQRYHANRPEASLQGTGREYKMNRDAPGGASLFCLQMVRRGLERLCNDMPATLLAT